MADPPLVLVVEDDSDTRDLIAEVLRDGGYRVATATNGREALELLEPGRPTPSVILLDLMMPVMNGWDFLDTGARTNVLGDIPVLVLSADPTRELAAQRRVVAVIGKPFELGRLLRLVRSVTRARMA